MPCTQTLKLPCVIFLPNVRHHKKSFLTVSELSCLIKCEGQQKISGKPKLTLLQHDMESTEIVSVVK